MGVGLALSACTQTSASSGEQAVQAGAGAAAPANEAFELVIAISNRHADIRGLDTLYSASRGPVLLCAKIYHAGRGH
jgi:hypothetical protein